MTLSSSPFFHDLSIIRLSSAVHAGMCLMTDCLNSGDSFLVRNLSLIQEWLFLEDTGVDSCRENTPRIVFRNSHFTGFDQADIFAEHFTEAPSERNGRKTL